MTTTRGLTFATLAWCVTAWWCAAAVGQWCDAWTLRSSSGPSSREALGLVHDRARRVDVLFGGADGAAKGDTWEWDGSTWTLRNRKGPSERYRHAMAHDSARGVTVLFGGFDRNEWNGETWEWNGTSWKLRSGDGPSARGSAGKAYDSEHGVTVLFGGVNYGSVDKLTWIWDGSSWSSRSVSGPSSRGSAGMAYDEARGVTVMFGGTKGGEQTWEFSGVPTPSWSNYGTGWPGTNGIPSFAAEQDPRLCSIVTLDLDNSLGATTTAFVLLGAAPTDQPTGYDGRLLVVPSMIRRVALPGGGGALPALLPCDCALAGVSLYLQAVEVDVGASQGISFTAGLQLVLGSSL